MLAHSVAHSLVSHSLRLLKLHDMIRAERVGHLVRYRIDPGHSNALLDHVRRPDRDDSTMTVLRWTSAVLVLMRIDNGTDRTVAVISPAGLCSHSPGASTWTAR